MSKDGQATVGKLVRKWFKADAQMQGRISFVNTMGLYLNEAEEERAFELSHNATGKVIDILLQLDKTKAATAEEALAKVKIFVEAMHENGEGQGVNCDGNDWDWLHKCLKTALDELEGCFRSLPKAA